MSQKAKIHKAGDWVGNRLSFLVAWGIPVIAMAFAGFLDPSIRMGVWIAALVWMGSACLINARHCHRTHCKFTGPFFLLMSTPVLMLGLGVVSLGAFGWWWLAGGILAGTIILWWGSEALLGKYASPD